MPFPLADAQSYKANYVYGRPSGVVYVATTAVAGVAPGTALSTTPPLAIWNPTGSAKTFNLINAAVGYISGTLGAGTIVFAQVADQVAAPTTGTELTVRAASIGGAAGVGRAFQGSTVASTPLILRPFAVMGAALATSVAFPSTVQSFSDQGLSIRPGTCLILQGVAAAGSSPLVLLSMTWEEVPN